MQLEKAPIVTVCVIAYNHGRYLRQCLQSIVDQQTQFPFEVIVGDDFSTDNTPEIICEFADRYPQLVIPILNRTKIGGTQNYVTTHLRARGDYVAHIDGDDLAYPGKLQLQAEYLDARKGLALVWHAVEIINDAGEPTGRLHRYIDDIVDTANITRNAILRYGPLGAASSAMYRRAFANDLMDIKEDSLDYYFAARLLEHGNGARLKEVLGGYRYDPDTVTLSKTKSPYFRDSPMRKLYAKHLKHMYNCDKRVGDDIFLNSLFNSWVELRFLRPAVFAFLYLAMRTISISAVRQIPRYFLKALRLRIR